MSKLVEKRCIPCEGGVLPLAPGQVSIMLRSIPEWQANENRTQIYRVFHFENYYQTIAFANAIAWIAHQEDHHPRLEIEYNSCTVRYSTQAIQSLSENDFICAEKVDSLYSKIN